MTVRENLKLVWEDTRATVLARHPEWLLDALLSAVVDPCGTVVITGFWRSGTTWMLEALSRSLGAKPIFEPLKPDTTGYYTYVAREYLGEDEARDAFMPFCTRSLSRQPALRDHLVRSLTGAVPGVFVRAAQFSVRQSGAPHHKRAFKKIASRIRFSFRTRVITKFTRAHLLIPLLQAEFGSSVVHIRRDPRAVVESLSRQAWAGWINSMSLEDYLLRTGDGRRDVFSKWTDEIRRCDQAGPVARVSGYWALVEWYVDQFASGDELVIQFEHIVEGGSKYLNGKLGAVPGISLSEQELDVESRTSERKSRDQRLLGWKEKLNSEEIEEIEKAVQMFGMEDSLLN